MIAVIFYCLLPLLVHCEYGSFNITTPGQHVIEVKSSGFEINICVNNGQTSTFCYGGKPSGRQNLGCGSTQCGIVATHYSEKNNRVLNYGGASVIMDTSCVKVKIQENKQTISGMNDAGNCTWDREKDGRLVIWTQFDPSSPIEV
uniref:Lectin n=1 Tax=Panagrolaimus sp. JU765 TaxID=591449 RepID=A0AC34R7N3_9BILA